MDQKIQTRSEATGISGSFDGDVLERKQTAERLTNYVNRLSEGCVIGIDAPWGEGKTWFGRHWAAQLAEEGFPVVWLDTFETDHSEDPFISITAEIYSKIKKDETAARKLIDKAGEIGKSILPAAAKAGIGFAGRTLFGIDLIREYEEQGKKAVDGAGAGIEKLIEKRLKEHDLRKKSVEGFRKTLSELVATKDKPLVIFVDELDRCRPDYAVEFIERIKHFFDVKGLVFVLLLHRTQLQEAIKGIYGQGVDATQYLAKFVHFFMTLPKSRRTDVSGRNALNAFCKRLEQRHGFPVERETNNFTETFATLSRLLELSLRDIEKGYIVAALAGEFGGTPEIFAWIVALKMKHPEIFLGVLANRPEASVAAKEILSKFLHLSDQHAWLLALSELHTAAELGHSDGFSVESQHALGWTNGRGSEKFLRQYAAKVDLAL